MANLQGTYSLTSYHPYVDWKISYSQTARTSTTATYNFTVSMTLKTGVDIGYGYNIFLSLSQGGTTKVNAHRLKADGNTDMYAGTWSTTFSATLNTDASGGTIPSIRIWSTSTQDSTHYQQALDVTGEVTKSVYGSIIKVWNGSAFINGKANVWDGSTWKPATIKVWNGTSWTISK